MSSKDRITKQIVTNLSPNELAILDNFIAEKGFKARSEFVRAAISAYIGEDIFRPRFHDPKLKIDEWNKINGYTRKRLKVVKPPKEPEPFERWKIAGGEVIINTDIHRIQVAFNEPPSKETIWILRLNHFVWRPNVKVWQTVLKKSALKKVHELECLKPIEE